MEMEILLSFAISAVATAASVILERHRVVVSTSTSNRGCEFCGRCAEGTPTCNGCGAPSTELTR